jgi:hypothetical protein
MGCCESVELKPNAQDAAVRPADRVPALEPTATGARPDNPLGPGPLSFDVNPSQYRTEAWNCTHVVLKRGRYVSRGGDTFDVRRSVVNSIVGVRRVSLSEPEFQPASRASWPRRAGRITAVNCDPLVAAEILTQRNVVAGDGVVPLVVDDGHSLEFGQGYQSGSRSLEAELCRRTSLAFTCDPAVSGHPVRGGLYPIPPRDVIMVPDVIVMREDVQGAYELKEDPFLIGVAIASLDREVMYSDGGDEFTGQTLHDVRAMIRTLLLAAAASGYRAIVISGIGLEGAVAPAFHEAALFRDALLSRHRRHGPPATPTGAVSTEGEEPLRHYFDDIVFAIDRDTNPTERNPNGFFAPFAVEFVDVEHNTRFLDALEDWRDHHL